jgi:diguanylate cyclase (GGDEF)-like protein
MTIDPKTLMLMNLITNVVALVIMGILWNQHKGRYQGLTHWLVNMVFQALSIVLFVSRGLIPDFLSIVAANVFLQLGAWLILIGLERFFGKPSRHAFNVAVLSFFTASFSYWALVDPNLKIRTLLLAACMSVLMVRIAWFCFITVAEQASPATKLTGAIAVSYIIINIYRIVHKASVRESGNDYFRYADVSDIIALLSYITLAMFLVLALVLLVNGRLLGEVREQSERLQELATHDALTGLPNRRLFSDRFEIAVAGAARNKERLAIISLDLDRFKEINDASGHEIGDHVLQEASNRIHSAIRKEDTLARFGGDEFVLLLMEIHSVRDAEAAANKIKTSLSKPCAIDGKRISIEASLGIAIYPDDGEDLITLLRKSDEALYYVKAHGRAGYRAYSTGFAI